MPNYRVTLNYTTTVVVNAADSYDAEGVAEELVLVTGSLADLDVCGVMVKETSEKAVNE